MLVNQVWQKFRVGRKLCIVSTQLLDCSSRTSKIAGQDLKQLDRVQVGSCRLLQSSICQQGLREILNSYGHANDYFCLGSCRLFQLCSLFLCLWVGVHCPNELLENYWRCAGVSTAFFLHLDRSSWSFLGFQATGVGFCPLWKWKLVRTGFWRQGVVGIMKTEEFVGTNLWSWNWYTHGCRTFPSQPRLSMVTHAWRIWG